MKNIILITILIGSLSIANAQNNLGVNQPNPTAKTHITNTENQNSLQVDDETGDATPFVVDSLGNVGVKEASPQADLDVNGGIKADSIQLTNGATDGATLQSDANGNASWNEINIAVFQDRRASNVSGGTATASWNTRELNYIKELIGTDISVDLASNQITLQPGIYKVRVNCTAFRVYSNQIKLQNISLNNTLSLGTSVYGHQSYSGNSVSTIDDVIEITDVTSILIKHFCGSGVATNGFGVNSASGEQNIYTTIYIEKNKIINLVTKTKKV